MSYLPIEEYGVIGDLRTVAHVGINGSIDFMCFPQFDSPSVFCAMLDHERGGFFQIAPQQKDHQQKQLYFPDTNILLTRFLFEQGVSEVCDFMPIGIDSSTYGCVVREVKTIIGEISYRMVCRPGFDYARCGHRIEASEYETVLVPDKAGLPALRLSSSVPVHAEGAAATVSFDLKTGQTAYFILEQAEQGQKLWSSAADFAQKTKSEETIAFWRGWIGKSKYHGRWREIINRSALALKLMTHHPTGAVVAAPTFGLPETIGGSRNWDYRYTWIRDASFTLYALFRLGYTEEAARFMSWIEQRCSELEPGELLSIMYSIDGRRQLVEERLDHLEGYKGSTPVRIGNCAFRQTQLDIYGELMDFIFLYNKHGNPISFNLWKQVTPLIDWVCQNWNQKDDGIWEVRGTQQEFLYSRVMCWVALDRAIRLALKRSLPAPLSQWTKCRDAIWADIVHNFWHPRLQAFVQYKGSNTLDAAALFLPLVRFIGPTDPMWTSNLQAVEDNLVFDSLVYRYRPGRENPCGICLDGLCEDEGSFNMCTFLYVECLSRQGTLDKARYVFEKMLGFANHLGLYAEELGPQGQHLGNFPQAFTHIGLISAAYDLNRRLSVAGERA